MDDEQVTSPTFKDKLRQTLCFSCCFRNGGRGSLDSPSSEERLKPVRASSIWPKSGANDLPEIRDRCRHLISRIGRNHRRHTPSADFRYDPLSYSLNFDDAHLDETPFRNFSSSRVSVSPQLKTVPESDDFVKPAASMEIICA